jgi:hypothetical protein
MKTATRQPPKVEPSVSPFAQRHLLRSEIASARVARDVSNGQLRQIEAEHKSASDDAFQAEMELVTNPKAVVARDAAVERIAGAEAARVSYERALAAATQLVEILQGKLQLLFDTEFEFFAREAESYSRDCEKELRKLRQQAAVCAQAWSKAASMWRPLSGPLRERLETLNERDGVYPDVVGQSIVRSFPLDTQFISSLAPRPRGAERLNRAERNGGV